MTYWITETLGTQSVDEAIPEGVYVAHLFDLNDGWNPPTLLLSKAKLLLPILLSHRKLVLICQAGISRSNAIAALLLAYLNNTTWDDAYYLVRKRVPRAQINMALRDSCIEALKLLRALPEKHLYNVPNKKEKGSNPKESFS